jgi:hypothetical protein
MTPTIHILSLCGILIFGVGGFMLVWAAQNTGKPSPITLIAACTLLAIGAGLFVTDFLVPGGSSTAFKPCGAPACEAVRSTIGRAHVTDAAIRS